MFRINIPKKQSNSSIYIFYDGTKLVVIQFNACEKEKKRISSESVSSKHVTEKILSLFENINLRYSKMFICSINEFDVLVKKLFLEKAKRKKIDLNFLLFDEILKQYNKYNYVDNSIILTQNFTYVEAANKYSILSKTYHLKYIFEQVIIAVYKKFNILLGDSNDSKKDFLDFFLSCTDSEIQQSIQINFNSIFRDIFLFFEISLYENIESKRKHLFFSDAPIVLISESNMPKEVIKNLQRFLNRGVICNSYDLEQIAADSITKESSS